MGRLSNCLVALFAMSAADGSQPAVDWVSFGCAPVCAVGGAQPSIIHYTSNKPMVGPQPGEEGHQFLCSLDELETRAAGATPGRSSDSGSGSSGAPSQQL